jgi:hypothetical protein
VAIEHDAQHTWCNCGRKSLEKPRWPRVAPPWPSKYSKVVSKRICEVAAGRQRRAPERDRQFAEQRLAVTVERFLDEFGHGAVVGGFLAEPGHRLVGLLQGECRSAGNAQTLVPVMGMAVGSGDHQAVQHGEVDGALPSTTDNGRSR